MTYHTDSKVRKYMQGYNFLSFEKKFKTKYGKKFVKKGISASERIKTAEKRFNESKYGKN